MATSYSQHHCKTCERQTMHVKHSFSGGMGCLLTILTGGLFIPIWLLILLWQSLEMPRCQVCGAFPSSALPSAQPLIPAESNFPNWLAFMAFVLIYIGVAVAYLVLYG